MIEQWRPIRGYEGFYEVSNTGRVRSLPRTEGHEKKYFFKGRELKQSNSNGYLVVGLAKYGNTTQRYVHRLVAETFIPNPEGKTLVNHIDENRQNNRADNLAWVTQQENLGHGTRSERMRARATERQGRAVLQVDEDGNIVAEYPSLSEAARAVGASVPNIWKVLNRRSISCKGYFWWYKEP